MRVTNWPAVLSITEPQLAYSTFLNMFMQCYESCFPIKSKPSVYKSRKPWLSSGLLKSIKTKNKLYVKYVRRPTLFNHIFYKEFRNKLHSLMRRVEREYYDKELIIHKNNLRKPWEIIKEVINPKKRLTCQPGGATITDKYAIGQQFNNFYVNIGNNLSKDIPAMVVIQYHIDRRSFQTQYSWKV